MRGLRLESDAVRIQLTVAGRGTWLAAGTCGSTTLWLMESH